MLVVNKRKLFPISISFEYINHENKNLNNIMYAFRSASIPIRKRVFENIFAYAFIPYYVRPNSKSQIYFIYKYIHII